MQWCTHRNDARGRERTRRFEGQLGDESQGTLPEGYTCGQGEALATYEAEVYITLPVNSVKAEE